MGQERGGERGRSAGLCFSYALARRVAQLDAEVERMRPKGDKPGR